METHPLQTILKRRTAGEQVGIYSACTAHPLVLEAVIEAARDSGTYALIEATANQVDQFGGYTGMTPADFAQFVRRIATEAGLPAERLILGGDHLGSLVWHDLPEAQAMANAEELIRAYVQAGFSKIHLDTSMRLGDDDPEASLSDATIARRAAQLAAVAEETFAKMQAGSSDACNADFDGERMAPVYVIGSEVPVPGGAHDNEESVSITTPEHFTQTYEAFKTAFMQQGLRDAFERIVAIVVQPGVEFSDETVTAYNRAKAAALTAELAHYPDIVFEGHSTDYQTRDHLRQMVEDGIAILKVGPALTFALREALFVLSDIEDAIHQTDPERIPQPSNFKQVLLDAMRADPQYWEQHYRGTDEEIEHKLLYSLSDRCRYYLANPAVQDSIAVLLDNIDSLYMPDEISEAHLPDQYQRIKEGKLPLSASALIKSHIKDRITDYLYAVDAVGRLQCI